MAQPISCDSVILQNGVHEDSHRTRLDQNRGMSEQRDLHGCPARGKHRLTHSDRAGSILANALPSPSSEISSSVCGKARDQLLQALASAFANRNPVSEHQRVEVELEQRPDACTQSRGVVHDTLGQKG